MTAAYEAEVRVPVPRIDALRARLDQIGAQIRRRYAFTDEYYQPESGPWPPARQSLRVREFANGDAEVLFSRVTVVTEGGVTFKRSTLTDGKLTLMRAPAAICRDLLRALGFAPWLRVRKRRGEIIEIPSMGAVALEDIDEHGWWLEVEADGADVAQAAAELRRRLDALQIDPALASPLPIAALIASKPARGRRAYFCGAIRGGRQLQARYARFIEALQQAGWTVLTAHVGAEDVLEHEARGTTGPADIWHRDMAWLAEADVVVADVTVPSLGVGIELATALARGTPVIALVEAGASLSALVLGDERITLVEYTNQAQAAAAMLTAVSAAVR